MHMCTYNKLQPGTWYQETDGEGPGYGNIDIMASNKRHIKILGNGNDIYRNVRMMCPYNLQGNIFISCLESILYTAITTMTKKGSE